MLYLNLPCLKIENNFNPVMMNTQHVFIQSQILLYPDYKFIFRAFTKLALLININNTY